MGLTISGHENRITKLQFCCYSFFDSYHQKIPAEPTELESTPQYGIASPIEFPIPAPAPLWTADLMTGFDVAKSQPKVFFFWVFYYHNQSCFILVGELLRLV